MMMFSSRRASFLLTFLFLGIAVWGERYPPARNCEKNYECPSYTVVDSNKEFEIRTYKDAQWVSTKNITAGFYTAGAFKGFTILFNYFNGDNKQNLKIDMTTPVLVDVDNSTYVVNFYLPNKYQKGPLPEPLSQEIVPASLPKYKYAAVRRYGGFINEKNIADELAALKKALQGTKYEKAAQLDRYTVAGYNSPFELLYRVNEIFLWYN